MILRRFAFDTAIVGFLFGLAVAGVVAVVLSAIKALLDLSFPSSYGTAFMWTYLIWTALFMLFEAWAMTRIHRESSALALDWEVPYDEVLDAFLNHSLGVEPYNFWSAAEFTDWYAMKTTVEPAPLEGAQELAS